MSYNPAFSKVLYVVPTVDGEGSNSNSNAVSDTILAGGSLFSSGTTLQNDANGVSSTQRAFIPVNAPEEGPGGGGIDYGTFAQNLAAQRLQSWRQTGPGATTAGAERQDASHTATNGPDGTSRINVAVYGNVRT
jgi:hypothetical protein